MASIARTVGDFEVTQAVAVRSGNVTARIITYAGNPNGATITPTPTLGTVCIDSTSGEIWQFLSGTSWQRAGSSVSSNLDWKQSCRLATTGNIVDLETGAPNTVDGISVASGDRILVKNQSTGSENGIYVVDTVGTGSNGAWSRSSDAMISDMVTTGMTTLIEQGTQANTLWILTTTGTIVLGTTALVFTSFGTYTAGSGIGLTNGVITAVADVDGGLAVTGTGIKAVSANAGVSVSSSGIGAVVDANGGLSIGASGLKTASTNGALTVTSSGLTVVIDAAGGLSIGGSGIRTTAANAGIAVSSSGVGVVAAPDGAITVGASGLQVGVDTTNGSIAIVGNVLVIPGNAQKIVPSATASQIVDSVPIATYSAVKWVISVKNSTTGRYASEVIAVSLGTGTVVDYSEYGVVQVGTFTTAVPTFTVTSDGTNMRLVFTGDAGNSVSVSRQAI